MDAGILKLKRGGSSSCISCKIYKGDNIHNIKVIKQKKGELLIYRRSKDSKFHASDFGPCPSCCMWLQLNVSITKHQNTCVAFKSVKLQKDTLIVQSDSIKGRKRNIIKKKSSYIENN